MNLRVRRSGSGALLAAPWLIGVVLVFAGPMIVSAALALTDWDGLSWRTIQWVGLANFSRAFGQDRTFQLSVMNTAEFAVMNVAAQTTVGLILALLVAGSRRVGLWATLFYVPRMFAGVATILIWWWLLNPRVGPINRLMGDLAELLTPALGFVGVGDIGSWSAPPWLYSPTWCRPSLVLMNLWQVGGVMLIFLAALLRGDNALYEAAKLDGAGAWRRFRTITIPRLSPAIAFNAVTGIVLSMQAFGQPFLLRNPQQGNGLLFYGVYLYQMAFERHRFGYACALAWIGVAGLFAFSAVAVLIARRYVHYDMEAVQ